jgi:hypothetical protein
MVLDARELLRLARRPPSEGNVAELLECDIKTVKARATEHEGWPEP